VQNGERLTAFDACFLYSENEYGVYQGAGIAIYDGPLDYERVVADIDSKLDKLPRLRQHPVPAPFHIAHPTWEYDPAFDIRDHIVRIDLGPDATFDDLLAKGKELAEDFIPRNKALWRIYVVERFNDGQGATINIVHHSLSDGGGMKAFGAVMNDLEPHPPRGVPGHREFPPTPSWGRRLVRALRDDAKAFGRLVTSAPGTLAGAVRAVRSRTFWRGWRLILRYTTLPTIKMPYNAPLSGKKHFAWTVIDLAELHTVRRALGATVNDVFLAITAAAIERFAHAHGIDTRGKYCLLQAPVDVRPPGREAELSNYVGTLSLAVPFGIDDPQERLQAVRASTAHAKETNLAWGMHKFLLAWQKAPTPPLARLIRLAYHQPRMQQLIQRLRPRPALHVCASNVMGSNEPVYLAGRKAVMHVPIGLLVHGCGLFCTAFSYCGKMYFGATTDGATAPDVESFVQSMIDEYLILCEAAEVVRTGAAPAISPPPEPPESTVQPRAHTNGKSKHHDAQALLQGEG
jgi:diacylglycerol O-acyltransferase / wax synthase